MNRRAFLAGLLAAVIATPTSARMHAPYRGHRIVASAAAPPLDGLTTPSGAYGFRKLRSAYAGNAIRLRRASDNLELDIGFLGFVPGLGAPWDEAAANAHCASTTCFSPNWYDQSGVARNLPQATAANQPTLIFNCDGALPCLQFPSGTVVLQSGTTITPASGTVSFSAVAKKASGTSTCTLLAENAAAGNRLAISGTANTWGIFGGTSGSVLANNATDGAWHAANAVIAGAASVINIDGTEFAGTATGSVSAALTRISGNTSTACNVSEVVFWDNYPLSPSERAALRLNQQAYWGTP